MSRKAREPISLPSGVELSVKDSIISVKGPKGTLHQNLINSVEVIVEDKQVFVNLSKNSVEKTTKFQGLYWALIANMVKGVHEGFERKLEMIGVGYRASVQGSILDLSIGVSHPTKMQIPEGLSVVVEKNTSISIKGINKQLVGQFAASVRDKRPPEPYKGKGIRYENEYIRRKAGKAAKTGKK